MLAETRRLPRLLAQLEGPPGQTTGLLSGLRLTSHFQPIYSLSHARVVGHEALMRATDAEGKFVSPLEVLDGCKSLKALAWCDSLSRIVHLRNFSAHLPSVQWLFLNVHPQVHQLIAALADTGNDYIAAAMEHFQVRGDRLVIEVVESEMTDHKAFEVGMEAVRRHGALIAIDDFGSGHSNFDRVWRLKPDIVKLDRSLVARAGEDPRARRVVAQMVSLLHECGAMVLMEGVETRAEALVAMEADVDMVQGYFFGRPQALPVPDGHAPDQLMQLYAGLGQLRERARHRSQERLAPYSRAIAQAGAQLQADRSLGEACASFMALADAELCYVLDADGYQVGEHVWPTDPITPRAAYEPLRDIQGACWARRPYFRRAIENVGKVQFTRPYRTLHGNHTCVTASCAYPVTIDGRTTLRVVCGDMAWRETPVDGVDDAEA